MNSVTSDNSWHIDKRISVGSLIMTITATAALIFWIFQLDGRITVNTVRIQQNEKLIMQTMAAQDAHYQEIIRRLEILDAKIDRKVDIR